MRIGIIIFDGFDELDAIGPLEVFRMAASLGADIQAELVTREPAVAVTASHGLVVVPDCVYSPGEFGALLVVGGSWLDRSAEGAWTQVERGDWLPLLKAEADAGTTMLSVCTGAMLLAHAGVIGARRATTHASAHPDLADTGADVVDERVVDEGSLITCGGVTSGLDLALHFVGRLAGDNVATQVRRRLEY
ncbi:MAG: DJ-1/PfpI family protein [Actinomycetes bacterium]